MDYATRLNEIIDKASKGFTNISYSSSEDKEQSSLKVLENNNIFFTTSVLGMKSISHVIEQQAITQAKPFRLYSAFQKLSRFKTQKNRYERILATHNPVYIFGLPDIQLPADPNLTQVLLEEPLIQGRPHFAQNWFVVLHNPQFISMALVSREILNPIQPIEATNNLLHRNFEGFWTYDREVIAQVVEILDGYIKYRLGN